MFKEQNIEIDRLLREKKEKLENQRNSWNKYSSGWKKWDDLIMGAMRPIGDVLVNSFQLRGNEKILDVATGTGEPGLSLCGRLPHGEVIGTDLSEQMVSIARENAKGKGLPNYFSREADAADLPFENGSFDHVVCRFGIMFFPEISEGLGEMARVMKPGGRMSVAVWAAPELNPFITLMGAVIMEKLGLPKPPPDAPGIFRCARPGYAGELLRGAGLDDVMEYNLKGSAIFDSPEHYWQVMSDVAGPLMQALEKAPEKLVKEVRDTVMEKAGHYKQNGKIHAGWEAIIASGIKA